MSNNINKTGVIGNPIEHSLSPEIHNYWIKQNQLKTEEYQKIKLDIDNLESQVGELIKNKFFGLNVTIPFKEELYLFCDDVSGTAKKLKAINTITCNNGKIFGTNTDPDGFINSLSNQIKNENITNKNALVIGAGGSSRSIIYALNKMGAHITLVNRTFKKSEQIVRDLNIEMQIENFESINKLVSGCDLIVNTTPLGMTGHKNIEIDFVNSKPNLHVYDLVYNPIETKLLKDAKDNNKTCQNGLDMLVYQAAESFKIWHGIYPNINNNLFSTLRRDK